MSAEEKKAYATTHEEDAMEEEEEEEEEVKGVIKKVMPKISTAYQLFCNDKRDSVKEKYPGMMIVY